MASAYYNPDCEEEWWIVGKEDKDEGESRTTREAPEGRTKKKKSKRRKITEELAEHQEEPFTVLHTAARQRQELVQTLLPALAQSLLHVEAAAIKLKVKHFIGFAAGEEEGGATPDMAQFLRASQLFSVCPQLSKWEAEVCDGQHFGAPLVMLLTTSAIRAVELRRYAASVCSAGVVAKLFARHMKTEEQAAFLSSHITPIAVATPNRARKLIEQGSLSLTQLKCVVVDWYYRDQKKRQFCDIPEVWRDFCELFSAHLNQLVQTRQAKLTLY